MGNSSGRETRSGGDRRSGESAPRSPPSSGFSFGLGSGPSDGSGRLYSSRGGRSSRNDLNLFGPGNGPSDREADPHGPRRETRQEREARKLEKERKLRAQERERSLKEEGIDGGYLVTLGTYVGPEDFSKPMVRRLQIERRLAPFWRGLNEHSSEWTEHQLVAAAHGLPIPAPDEIPVVDESPTVEESGSAGKPVTIPGPTASNLSNIPLGGGGQAQLHTPAFGAIAASPSHASSTSSSLFLGRAKGLASLSPPRDSQHQEMARQEVRLPREPHINGQPVEAYLYKDPGECPICFLYYPPFLNRTRCCDQPICSECFVQIKRPDPHQPEHTDPNSPAPDITQARPGEEEQQLVSEPATCPFCVMPEFGITYDPPPFRRGIMYADQPVPNSPIPPGQNSQPKRRRGQSVSATAPEVITTDMVRPDWAKRLADARAHAARRSAAATALHTAAYMMSSQGGSSLSGLSRRRRANDANGSGGSRELLHPMQMQHLMAVLEGQGSSRSPGSGGQDLFPARNSSRAGNQPEDLEELMMMEAIRQSLQAEEERKKKEDKDAAKAAKKEEKQRAKEAKKAEKAAKKNGGSYTSSRNNSQFFGSSSNLALDPPPRTPQAASLDADKGKGKAPGEEQPRMTGIGFNPLDEPTSVVGNAASSNGLAESSVGRRPSVKLVKQPDGDEVEDSSGSTSGSRPLQQDFNFGSLAEMIDKGNPEDAEETESSKAIETGKGDTPKRQEQLAINAQAP